MSPCKKCHSFGCNCDLLSPTMYSYSDRDHYDRWREEYNYDHHGNVYRHKTKPIIETPESIRAREEEEARRRKYEEAQRRKQDRVNRATVKECSECSKERPHDADDYICIVCRDGASALPKKSYGLAA